MFIESHIHTCKSILLFALDLHCFKPSIEKTEVYVSGTETSYIFVTLNRNGKYCDIASEKINAVNT